MPRQPSLDIPFVLHHVIVSGIERRDILLKTPTKNALLIGSAGDSIAIRRGDELMKRDPAVRELLVG